MTQTEIQLEISIPENKSHGLYSCPARIFKCAIDALSNVLADIFNSSIELVAYLSKLKMSRIIPFIAEHETEPNNYQPISLWSNFNRIFEKNDV